MINLWLFSISLGLIHMYLNTTSYDKILDTDGIMGYPISLYYLIMRDVHLFKISGSKCTYYVEKIFQGLISQIKSKI